MARGQLTVDLDQALEYVLVQRQELAAQADTRLEALFSTVAAVGDFSFYFFDEVC